MKKLISTVGLIIATTLNLIYGQVDFPTLQSWTDSYEEAYPGQKIPHVNAQNTRVLNFEKIVRSTYSDDKDEVDYLLDLAQTQDKEAWKWFCEYLMHDPLSGESYDFYGEKGIFFVASSEYKTDSTESIPVSEENQAIYWEYVYQKLVNAFEVPIYRQAIILLYCAVHYYERTHKNNGDSLCWGMPGRILL